MTHMELKRFEYAEDQVVRELTINDGAWFLAKDVCEILEIENSAQAIDRLDDDEKLLYKVHIAGQKRDTWIINESGLYHLVLTSTKEEAKSFRKWITSEVIPQIRREGKYTSEQEKFRNRRIRDLRGEIKSQKSIFNKMRKAISVMEHELDSLIEAEPNQLHIFGGPSLPLADQDGQ